jgi:hypothetical protein
MLNSCKLGGDRESNKVIEKEKTMTRVFAFSRFKFNSLIALFLAFGLSLTLVSNVLATDSTVINGDFNDRLGCSLSGWTTTGQVSAVDGSNERLFRPNGCVAKVYAETKATSTLRQSFRVPFGTDVQFLSLVYWARSENGYKSGPDPDGVYLPQAISVYDAYNNVIYSKKHNWNFGEQEKGGLKLDLSAYAGQMVTLEVTVAVDISAPTSPAWATLYIDQVGFVGPFVPWPGQDQTPW